MKERRSGIRFQVTPDSDSPNLFSKAAKTATEIVRATITSEIVIAFVGPIGSPLHDVAVCLQNILRDSFQFEARIILLSKFIEDYVSSEMKSKPGETHSARVNRLIHGGDTLRKKYGPGVLAELAINEIHKKRKEDIEKNQSSALHPVNRVCHIIDSVKNQEELNVLRLVYRDMLYCVGVLSPIESRVDYLQTRSLSLSEIYALIDKDSGEELPHGQTVRDTFPQADFFLRVANQNRTEIKTRLHRFLQVILATEIVTPTIEEQAMFMAASASTNSACLSRQVGATVTDPNGHILGVGWNDVPKANGGLYHAAGGLDERCMHRGKCYNDERKTWIQEEITDSLIEAKVIKAEVSRDTVAGTIGGSKIKDLIEFSRSIHAEMHAIITAAQKTGDRMLGGSLFVTTYPCHSCARHIVAAGIKDVYYIEPYRKSLAVQLHGDAISEKESETGKVRILPFDGIAPGRYLSLFKMRGDSRKKDGKLSLNRPADALPAAAASLQSLPQLEDTIINLLVQRKLVSKPNRSTYQSQSNTATPDIQATTKDPADSTSDS